MMSNAELADMKAEARRVVAAMPPLTPEEVALVCELFEPLTAVELRAASADRAARREATNATPHHTAAREARSA